MKPLSYLSVCAGIEAATVAWHDLGFVPVAFSEIEKFPCAVLKHRCSKVPNLGDMTKFHLWPERCDCAGKFPLTPESIKIGHLNVTIHVCSKCQGITIDILVGGTPCQAFSVAGLRKGLDDPRGNLALVFLALVRRYRPRWVVWENVPGVHSSWSDESVRAPAQTGSGREIIEAARRDAAALGLHIEGAGLEALGDGAFEEVDQSSDFDCFLGGLAELGYGFATRVLDAQFFGLAQRRERVFVVAHLGAWQPAAAVLFEPESLRWDSPPSHGEGEGTSGTLTRSALDGSSPCGGDGREGMLVSGPLGAGSKGKGWADDVERAGAFIPTTVGALTDGAHQGGGSMARTPTPEEFLPRVAWCLQERDAKGADSDTKPGHLIPTPRGGFPDDGKPIPFDTTQITSKDNRSQPKPGDPSHPITAAGHAPAIAFSCKDNGRDATEELSPTLQSMNHSGSHANGGGQVAIAIQGIGKRTGKSAKDVQHGSGISGAGDPMFTLNASEQHGVAFKPSHYTRGRDGAPSEIAPPLMADADKGDNDTVVATLTANYGTHYGRSAGANGGVAANQLQAEGGMDVRRLTPRECERLQGFPDDYTLIPWSGKPAESCPDGPRYRALGNSMATTVMKWIGRRLQIVDEALYP